MTFTKNIETLEKSFPFIKFTFLETIGLDIHINNNPVLYYWYSIISDWWNMLSYKSHMSFNEFLEEFVFSLIKNKIY